MLVTEANKKTCEEIKMIAIKAVRIYVTIIKFFYNSHQRNLITPVRNLYLRYLYAAINY